MPTNSQPAAPGLLTTLQDFFAGLPPVTRALFAGSIILPIIMKVSPALYPYFTLMNLSTGQLSLFQPWRLFTNFFISGFNMNLLFHLFFLYRYSLDTESTVFSYRTSDYLYFIVFCCLGCDALGYLANLYAMPGALIMCIIYNWSQINSESSVSFMFGLKFQAKFLPWVMLAFEMIQKNGAFPIDTFIGIIIGHTYYFLETVMPLTNGGIRYLATPQFVKNYVPDFIPPGGVATGELNTAGAATTKTWSGKGQRLGKD